MYCGTFEQDGSREQHTNVLAVDESDFESDWLRIFCTLISLTVV